MRDAVALDEAPYVDSGAVDGAAKGRGSIKYFMGFLPSILYGLSPLRDRIFDLTCIVVRTWSSGTHGCLASYRVARAAAPEPQAGMEVPRATQARNRGDPGSGVAGGGPADSCSTRGARLIEIRSGAAWLCKIAHNLNISSRADALAPEHAAGLRSG